MSDNVIDFRSARPGRRKRRVMTGDEFSAHVAEMSPSERAHLSARLRRMADGISPAVEPRVTGRQRASRKRNPLPIPTLRLSLPSRQQGNFTGESRSAERITSTTLDTSTKALRLHNSSPMS